MGKRRGSTMVLGKALSFSAPMARGWLMGRKWAIRGSEAWVGKRVAYGAQVGNKWLVVVDGKEERQYDGIGQSTLIFSPDGKRVAYGAQVGNKWLVVVDGKEGRQYDDLFAWAGGRIVFNSPDGLHYLASEGNKIYLVEEKIK